MHTQSLDAQLEVVYEGGRSSACPPCSSKISRERSRWESIHREKLVAFKHQPPLSFTRRGKSWPVLVRNFAYLSFSCRGAVNKKERRRGHSARRFATPRGENTWSIVGEEGWLNDGRAGIREKRVELFDDWRAPSHEINVALLRVPPVDSGRHGSDSADIGVTTCFVRRRLERHKSLTGRRGVEGKRSDGSITEIAVMAVPKSFTEKSGAVMRIGDLWGRWRWNVGCKLKPRRIFSRWSLLFIGEWN